MPNLDDYHAFKSTSSDNSYSGGGSGCSGSIFTWIVVILAVLWLIGKLSA